MLTLHGPKRSGFCDGITRRNFLRIGGLAMGGLSLRQLLEAEARAGIKNSHKSVIIVYSPGGRSPLETFDMKPDAPAEIRGQFKPISTNLPGVHICEHLPRLAQMMNKVTVIRSLADAVDDHSSNYCLS